MRKFLKQSYILENLGMLQCNLVSLTNSPNVGCERREGKRSLGRFFTFLFEDFNKTNSKEKMRVQARFTVTKRWSSTEKENLMTSLINYHILTKSDSSFS